MGRKRDEEYRQQQLAAIEVVATHRESWAA